MNTFQTENIPTHLYACFLPFPPEAGCGGSGMLTRVFISPVVIVFLCSFVYFS